MIYSIAILGKRNEPLYFDCSEEPAEALNLQAVTYSCLDVIDERKKKISSASNSQDIYMGQLICYLDYKLIGLCSGTDTKIILSCDISTSDSGPIRDTVLGIYNIYVNTILNPFQSLEKPIQSSKFRNQIQQLISKTNNSSKK